MEPTTWTNWPWSSHSLATGRRSAVLCVLVLISGCSPPATSISTPDTSAATPVSATRPPDSTSSIAGGRLTAVGGTEPLPKDHAAGEDWAAFLGPRGDGTARERPLDPELWQPGPPLLYSLDLGTSYGGPAITDRYLFQFCRYGDQERLTCYDVRNGTPLWHRQQPVTYDDMYGYNNGPRCMPIVDEDLVFTYGVAGRLTCYRVRDGEIVWTRDINAEYGVVPNFFGVASTPRIHNDLLLVMVGGSPADSQHVPPGRLDLVRPNGSAIVAFDKRTGEEIYRVGNDLASYSAIIVRRLTDHTMGLAFLRNGLLAWEVESGQELFHFPWRSSKLESVNAATPVTFDEHILLSEAYEIGSVLLRVVDDQPRVVWQDHGPLREHAFRAHWATPIAIDGYLYGCSGRNQPDADFRCVRLADGQVQWFDRRHERSTLILVDGYLIVWGELGNLELVRPSPDQLQVVRSVDLHELIDPRDGRPLLSAPCWAPPVLSHGRLFLRGRNKLACFRLIPQPEVTD
ncbi:MAG: hypothetical protein KatS3mg111_3412 [Pirellulaceae bacterium]|nr:MAG: hypothetical protein KatS3mg111_3412 [Pirellulaceae bacterium]